MKYFFRSDSQAILLVNSLLNLLPKDCYLIPKQLNDFDRKEERFFEKAMEICDHILSKNDNDDSENHSDLKERIQKLRKDPTFTTSEFVTWRRSLSLLMNELECIYDSL